jgi:hypothetical protein
MKRTEISLDPTHPTLDHHRPGEFPLFGTAMGVSAMIGAVDEATGIDAVAIHRPFLLTDPATQQLFVETASDGVVARVVSDDAIHFEGRVRKTVPKPVENEPAFDHDFSNAVTAGHIYDSFFHGPAFQLVVAARFTGKSLISRLSTAPVTLALPSHARLIEFALQSAGLLELALTGRMMIPDRIAHLTVSNRVAFAPRSVVANATQCPLGLSDISVLADGHPLLTIKGYATVALPFAFDPAKLTLLRAALLASSRVAAC